MEILNIDTHNNTLENRSQSSSSIISNTASDFDYEMVDDI